MMSITLLALTFGVFLSEGKTCYMSTTSTPDGCIKWVVRKTDLSECTNIIFGGHSTSTDEDTFASFDEPLLSFDAIKIPLERGNAIEKDARSSTDVISVKGSESNTVIDQAIVSTEPVALVHLSTSDLFKSETTYPTEAASVLASTSNPVTHQSTSGCPNPANRSIDDIHTYRMFKVPTGLQRIEFYFRISKDAHIVLSPCLTSSDLYEVVIGGWSNAKSVIRKCLQECPKAENVTNHFLTSTELRKFWITFNTMDGSIAVGRGNDAKSFLMWSDPDPLQINYIGYSKFHDIEGEFVLCNVDNTIIPPCKYDMINDDCTCNEGNGTTEVRSCYCRDNSVLAGKCQWFPDDCYQLRNRGVNESGVYTIQTPRQLPIHVYCDMETDNGGWTVFQRRVNGVVDFKRNWAEYKRGFGTLDLDFWLGNEKVHQLTINKRYILRIDMEMANQTNLFAIYDNFKIGTASEKYRLETLGTFSGRAGPPNAMNCHFNMEFSTFDNDNDRDVSRNCADAASGGWWFNGGSDGVPCKNNHCKDVNLNGEYNASHYRTGIVWNSNNTMLFSEMKIRPF